MNSNAPLRTLRRMRIRLSFSAHRRQNTNFSCVASETRFCYTSKTQTYYQRHNQQHHPIRRCRPSRRHHHHHHHNNHNYYY